MITKIKKILFEPEAFFSKLREKGFGEAYKFFAILLLVSTALGTLVYVSAPTFMYSINIFNRLIPTAVPSVGSILTINIFSYLAGLLFVFAWVGLMHLWVRLWGGKGNFSKTFQIYAYSGTPAFLLGWVPILGYLTLIYTFILLVIGTMKLHKIEKVKCIIMYLIPVVFFAIIGLLILLSAVFILRMSAPAV